MQRIYVGTLFDQPGVVAANNYLSFFMPANSPKFAVALLVSCWPYSIGASMTPNSMQISRISAASGGTLIAANQIPRFVDTDEDPVLQMRSSNPTVTTSRLPLVAYPPPITSGVGGGQAVTQSSPGGASFSILPGSGLVFSTAAGNVSQMWDIQFIWTEVYLPPSS